MYSFLSHFLALVVVLAIATPAYAMQGMKAKPESTALSNKVAAKDPRAINLLSTRKAFLPGHNQFKRHRITAPAKKHYAPMRKGGSNNFFANITYESSWADASNTGIYSISTSAPAVIEQVSSSEAGIINLNMGGTATPTQIVGTYYVNLGFFSFLQTYIYDRETFELISSVEGDVTALAMDMDYDPATGNVYGLFYNEAGNALNLGTFNPEQGNSTTIAPIDGIYKRLAASKDGTLYVMDDLGNLGTIDKETAKVTILGNFGVTSDYPCSAAIDPRSGLIYYMTSPEEANSELYTIDPAKPTEANLVYTYPGNVQFYCAYFPEVKAKEGAPDEPVINSISFNDTSLRGKISFTAPTSLYDGSTPEVDETLRYEILANDMVIAQGSKVRYGHTYSATIEVPKADMYSFKVVVYNSVGASPKAEKELYVGPDSPAPVQNVKAEFAFDEMTVSWSPVTEGAHNGIIGNITYSIYDASSSALIAEAITSTEYTFDLYEPEEFTKYSYKVVAVSDGFESEAGTSNIVILGSIIPPYANSLSSPEDLEGWTIYDANADGKAWAVTDNGIRLTYGYAAANDYAITPAVNVKKGRAYNVSVAAKCEDANYPERLEIVVAKSISQMADASVALEPTAITASEFTTYRGTYISNENETVFFAIHGISDADMYNIYVKDFTIAEPLMSAAPGAAEFSVKADFNGEPKATVTYVTPDKAIDGSAITSLDKVEVLVDGQVQYVEKRPAPGATATAECTVPASGSYEFSVVAYNAAGKGAEAIASAFIGVPVPGAPTNASIEEVSDGVVTIKWDAPSVDAYGNAINPAHVSYAIVDAYSGDIVAESVTGTEYANIRVVPSGQQSFVCYAVFAMTSAGMCQNYAITNDLVVGTPYEVPFKENLANGNLSYNWIYDRNSQTIDLEICTDDMISGLTSRNNDNGFFMMYGQQYGDALSLISGKIAIPGDDPYLTFYTYGLGADVENTLSVDVICGGETTTVFSTVLGEDVEGCWNRHSVEMKNYAGKTVQLTFNGTVINISNILFDDISIGEPVKHDLVAKSISAPKSLIPGEEFDINYQVQNLGMEMARGYTVKVYANGELIETLDEQPSIEPGATYIGTIAHKPYSLFEAGTYAFNFDIDYEQDQEKYNNSSDIVKVTVSNTKFPTVDITGETSQTDLSVTLSWENPLIDLSSMPMVEDFENSNYPAFTTESFDGWTLLNFNESKTWGIKNIDFPGAQSPFGWILFDAEAVGLTENSNFYGCESPVCMAAFSHIEGPNDAWLISPELIGVPQTISFMAKCASTEDGPETMECLYSTTDTDPASFVKAEIAGYDTANGVTIDWEEYSFNIPAGAKYFAIRATATNCFALMVDNITYEGPSPFIDLEHIGFDVYRNGEKLNEQTITATTYTDKVPAEGKYTYNVVCVYNLGVSAPSNDFATEFESTGIADASAASAISVEGNTIVVTGASKVIISSADGKVVYSANGNDNCRATVASGVYIVKTTDATAKVIVK